MNADIAKPVLDSFGLIVPEVVLILAACVLFLGGTFRASRNLWGCAALVALAAAGCLLIRTTELTGPASIDNLVRRLGSDSPAEWQQAAEELERTGAAALPALRRAAGDRQNRPEVRVRSGLLVEKLEAQAAPALFGSSLYLDRLGLFVKALALAGAAVLVLVSWREYPEQQAAECFGCLLVVAAGLSLVGSANDLITLFLALELVSIPSYVLLYLPRHDRASQEAAMKYFLLSVFSSALLLFGFSYLYGLAGTTNLPAVIDALTRAGPLPSLALVALVMVTAGLGFRITAVPFHFYAPDVYQGTPASNAALLAFVPKAAGFIALMRVLAFVPWEAASDRVALPHPGLVLGADGLTLLWIMAVVTMTLGNILALLQDNLRRMLAYSSVAHAGYMLIGLAVAAAPRGEADLPGGVEAVLFYLVAYGAMTVGAFGVLAYLDSAERPVETVDDLAGLSRSHPGVSLLMAVFLFSLIGIPLTAGFCGKLFLFLGAMDVPDSGGAASVLQARYFRILAVIGAVNAAIGAAYYLRVAGVMFLRSSLRPLENRRSLPGLVGLGACAVVTLVFGVYPAPLLRTVERAVPEARTAGPDVKPAPAHARR